MSDDPIDNWTDEDEAAFLAWVKTNPEALSAYRRTLLPTVTVQIYKCSPILTLMEMGDEDEPV